MPQPLNDLEHRIYDYLVEYLRSHTYQPSIREIGSEFGIKSTKTVSEQLQALDKKGWIQRDSGRSRAIRLLGIDLKVDRSDGFAKHRPADAPAEETSPAANAN